MAKNFSTGTIVLVVLLGLAVVFGIGAYSNYNGMVSKDEIVTTAWSDVQSQYQRRSDLIPNLVNTVKGYAKHESETLEGVIAARAKATQITMSADQLTPENMKQIQQAQGELSAALGKLLAVRENYPDLKANQQFSELQAQLEGTENRINESRRIFNQAVQDYNVTIRRFPANIFAGLFGFEKKTKFEAEAGAEKAPSVSFD
ncbi:LemA [gut metagenome]|uniref:LemA n=1 Tax=gut metagenome TaxID=749906 RepID=J9GCL9_9ZZZZ